MVVLEFRTLLAIPCRPLGESRLYAKFSHCPTFKPLGLLRSPVVKKIEPFGIHVEIGAKIVISKVLKASPFELIEHLFAYTARTSDSRPLMSLLKDSVLSRACSHGQ